MSRAKTLLLAGFAVLALSAAMASAAFATEEWHVNGTGLGSGNSAALATLPKIDLSLILHISLGGPSILILCDVLHILVGRILWPNTDLAILDFLGCHLISPSPTNCKLKGEVAEPLGILISAPVLSEQLPNLRVRFKPDTGKLFTEIPFEEGTSCVLEGLAPVKGSVTAGTPTIHEEREEQAIEGLGSTENNSLEVANNKAFLLGKILVALASGKKWSFN
jgi:hypothetical protein